MAPISVSSKREEDLMVGCDDGCSRQILPITSQGRKRETRMRNDEKG